MKDETIAIHAGYTPDESTRAVAVPIHQTISFEFESAQHGADLFNLEVPGNIYTRIMNPTCDVLEQRVAQLEHGVAALAVSSGMAAVNYAILNLASPRAGATPSFRPRTSTAALPRCSRTCCRSSASRCASRRTTLRRRSAS